MTLEDSADESTDLVYIKYIKVNHLDPHSLIVEVRTDSTLIISGNLVVPDEINGFVTRSAVRHISIPKQYDYNELHAYLLPHGLLYVSAPKKHAKLTENLADTDDASTSGNADKLMDNNVADFAANSSNANILGMNVTIAGTSVPMHLGLIEAECNRDRDRDMSGCSVKPVTKIINVYRLFYADMPDTPNTDSKDVNSATSVKSEKSETDNIIVAENPVNSDVSSTRNTIATADVTIDELNYSDIPDIVAENPVNSDVSSTRNTIATADVTIDELNYSDIPDIIVAENPVNSDVSSTRNTIATADVTIDELNYSDIPDNPYISCTPEKEDTQQ